MAGTVSIIASGTPGTYVLPSIVAAFQNAHPGVRFQFELATSAGVVDAVRAHSTELGVTGGFIAAPELEAEPLFEDEIVVVGPPNVSQRRLTRDNLEELTWISREEGSATRAIADGALADLGIVPRRRLALPAWESIKIAVRAALASPRLAGKPYRRSSPPGRWWRFRSGVGACAACSRWCVSAMRR